MAKNVDPFEEVRKRELLLVRRLGAAPEVELAGVVDASGGGGGKAGSERLWTYTFTFEAWRVKGGAVRTDALVLRKKVADREMEALEEEVTPNRVLRVRARLAEDSQFPGPQALLTEILGEEKADAGLRAEAKRLTKPVTHRDAQFGKLTLDRRVDWYTGAAKWGKTRVKLNLPARDPATLDAALKTARALWKDQPGWDRKVRDYAVRELLALKNETWRDEDDPELSADDFLGRMKLQAVTAYADGSFEFWHDDGDLFWGHAIQVSGNLAQGLTNADIPG
jgi:hypothetical protein